MRALLPVLVAAVAVASCEKSQAAPNPPPVATKKSPEMVGGVVRDRPRPEYTWGKVFVQTKSGEVEVKVELALNDPQRMHGLMFKEKLPEMEGMIFVFPESSVHNFWMKNTLIPLDMIFVGDDRKVVGIYENAEPLSTARMGVGKPSRYVFEVNAGWSRKYGVTEGTQLRFEGVEP